MGTELVKRERHEPLPRWFRREKLGLPVRDWLWVYNDLVALVGSLAVCGLACVWLALPLTMHGWALALAIIAGLVALRAAQITAKRDLFQGETWALTRHYRRTFTHSERVEWCRMDRNRRLAPHHADRRSEPGSTQYSVWSSQEGGAVRLSLLEHRACSRRRWAMRVHTTLMTVRFGDRSELLDHPTTSLHEAPEQDELIAARETMEALAADLERAARDDERAVRDEKRRLDQAQREAARQALLIRRSHPARRRR